MLTIIPTTSAARKLRETSSLCVTCKRGIPAEIVEVDGRIVMRKPVPTTAAPARVTNSRCICRSFRSPARAISIARSATPSTRMKAHSICRWKSSRRFSG